MNIRLRVSLLHDCYDLDIGMADIEIHVDEAESGLFAEGLGTVMINTTDIFINTIRLIYSCITFV